MEFAVVDIEATGGNAKIGEITEVAVVIWRDGERLDSFSTLINPGIKIPPYVKRLTGITDEMTSDAPKFEEIAEELETYFEERILVAHNAPADISFLQAGFRKARIDFRPRWLCTLAATKAFFPDAESHGLSRITDHLGIPQPSHHRAMDDVQVTCSILHRMWNDDRNKLVKLIRPA